MLESIKDFFHFLDLNDLTYVVLIVMLFILPRILSRFGLPAGLGAFVLGFISANILEIFSDSEVIPVFATLGISSLFLYAGLELDFDELKKNSKPLTQHLIFRGTIIVLITALLKYLTHFNWQISALIALALVTPSTGFILDTLPSTKLNGEQKNWVKNMAIAAEILALLLLLMFQSETPLKLLLSVATIIILLFTLPLIFHWVSRRIAIKSPGADFSFLLLLAVATGTLTKKLGAYYLVGAFLVGFTVNFYEKNISKNPKEEFEKTAKFFASFFMPFYFFYAGLRLDQDVMSLHALLIGLALLVLLVPIRLGTLVLHRKYFMHESLQQSLPIATSLLPTLVFGLVMVDLLKFSGLTHNYVLGALIYYTIFVTLLPSIILKFLLRRQDLVEETFSGINPPDSKL